MPGVAVKVTELPVQEGLAPLVMPMLTVGVAAAVIVISLPLFELITGVASVLTILIRYAVPAVCAAGIVPVMVYGEGPPVTVLPILLPENVPLPLDNSMNGAVTVPLVV